MKLKYFKQNKSAEYVISILITLSISTLCFIFSGIIGYRTVALLLLANVSILSIFFSIYPILTVATLSALIWNFFFIPPLFTLHVENSEDALMFVMFFIIALLNGVLTSKIRQYEKIENQKEERQNTLKLYKTMFDSISHELRTPIATIVGATDSMLSKDSAPMTEENKKSLVNEISIAAMRLSRLVDNMLNMQRVESGFLEPKLDWCDVNDIVSNVLHRLKDELQTHHVTVETDEEMPLIKLDAGMIEQTIYNIVYNASIYTPSDSAINFEVILVNMTLRITISDSGPGFVKEELDKVFSKYFYSASPKKGGLGLGLSIAKGFVDAHNGKILVTNQKNSGAKFTIEIPTSIFQVMGDFDFSDLSVREKLNEQQNNNTHH